MIVHPREPLGPSCCTIGATFVDLEEQFVVEENVPQEHPLVGSEGQWIFHPIYSKEIPCLMARLGNVHEL